MKDSLGDRMKNQYENRTRYFLPRRTYTIIRLDGKAFHTYTKNLIKPFDEGLETDLNSAVLNIMPQIQGAVFAYLQSDEISILLTDFEKETTEAWFDGNIQKICSVSASLMTASFNFYRTLRLSEYSYEEGDVILEHLFKKEPLAHFDSRIFTIPDRTEVMNYFIWRNNDCYRNSVSMVAQSLFSHKELQGKSCMETQEMICQKTGKNWDNFDESKKNGRLIVKDGHWQVIPAWRFAQNMDQLMGLIPQYT